ncbi:MAG: hypothetical protein SFU87_01625, partial [Chitinophagaceae bacterium]|nr:hypothetical protein [Chitinophagaceae bacterium]
MKQYFLIAIIPALLILGCNANDENKSNDNSKSSTPVNSPGSINKKFMNIHIMAKPDSIAIDSARTAVIVVDMEN